MPRRARQESPTQFYHLMIRGINKERIFESAKHKRFLIDMLGQESKEMDLEIGAYCIMDNHLHLVIKGELDEISIFFKKVNTRFAMRYNKDLKRVGHVFQGRYRSEIILNDGHLMQAIRYVHRNPINAGILSNIEKYKWSSYKEYVSETEQMLSKEIKLLVLDLAGGKNGIEKFHSDEDNILFLDTAEEVEKIKQKFVNNTIGNYCEINEIEISEVKNNGENLKELIELLLRCEQLTHREISDLLNVNRNLVHIVNRQKGPSLLPKM